MKKLVLTLFLAACSSPGTSPDGDVGAATDTDTTADAAPTTDAGEEADVAETAPDASTLDPNLFASDCAAVLMDGGQRTSNAPCSASDPVGTGTRTVVRADCTDPEITAHLDKAHVVLMPDAPTRDVLWVHLPGTGGEPTNTENIGVAAMREGYRFIGLAYPNDRNTNDRCQCPDGPRPAGCKELVRYEMVTGEDVTPWFDMEPDEAIVPRLTALLSWLQADNPTGGWEAFTDANGAPIWSKIAVSGFSQGGGMTAMIGREFALDRQLHFSHFVGSLFEVLVDPSTAKACSSHDDCSAAGVCCTVADAPCAQIPDDAICIEPAPEPWAALGADADGDGRGDGDQSTRATPVDRVFVIVHRRETAWLYTPEVTELIGIGSADAYIDVDTDPGPYPASARLFSTDLEPNGAGCSFHQAMGPDACQPRDAGGQPSNLPAWRHALTAEL